MINMIFAFRKDLVNKEIYIWNINHESVHTFMLLALHRVKIAGFVTDNKEFDGQSFFNRKIVSKAYLTKRQNVLVITPDEFTMSGSVYLELSKYVQVLPYQQVLCINEKLKDQSVIVYGTGAAAEKVYYLLDKYGIKIKAFCVSNLGEKRFFHNSPVVAFDDIKEKNKHVFILAVKIGKYKKQIKQKLNESGIENVFMIEVTGSLFEQENFFQKIYKAAAETKKIYIYGNKDETSQLLETVLSDYQIKIAGYAADIESPIQNIGNIYDLSYFKLSDIFVIINEEECDELQGMCETLENIGLSLEDFNYTAMGRTTLDYRHGGRTVPDILLGEAWLANKKYPGYYVYGESQPNNIKILILGGSTSSDGIYRPICWPKYLYEKLIANNCSVVVYNGAYPGHDVTQEFLRLIRDGAALKPDIVISMSGYNDTAFKEKAQNQFNVEYLTEWAKASDLKNHKIISGLKTTESLCDFWLRTERLMKRTAEMYGAEFYAFLQPMKCAQKQLNLFEASVFEREKRKNAINEFVKRKDMTEIINLITEFNYKEKMFIDQCHYSDSANRMLADIVYNHILGHIRKLETRNKKPKIR